MNKNKVLIVIPAYYEEKNIDVLNNGDVSN